MPKPNGISAVYPGKFRKIITSVVLFIMYIFLKKGKQKDLSTTMYKIDKQQGSSVWHREYIDEIESLCYIPEMSTTL